MREQGLLIPHDLSDWLPEDHQARFVIEIVDQLYFSNGYHQYKTGGSTAYDPKLLLRDWFKQVLLIGKEMNLLKMGEIYVDGSKIQAHASRHKAMSYTYMERIEKQLEEEIK